MILAEAVDLSLAQNMIFINFFIFKIAFHFMEETSSCY